MRVWKRPLIDGVYPGRMDGVLSSVAPKNEEYIER